MQLNFIQIGASAFSKIFNFSPSNAPKVSINKKNFQNTARLNNFVSQQFFPHHFNFLQVKTRYH